MRQRPVRWPTDEEFEALQATRARLGDRAILLALRLHDYHPDNPDGAYPGYKRIAALTGLSKTYVRNRLAEMARAGVIHSERRGRLAHYYIVAPHRVTLDGDRSGVTPGNDMSSSKVTRDLSPSEDTRPAGVTPHTSPSEATNGERHVTDVSPPERQGNGNRNKDNTSIVVEELEEAVRKVLEHYGKVHKNRRIRSDKEIKAVRSALEMGFSVNEICRAINGNSWDPWHRTHVSVPVSWTSGRLDQAAFFVSVRRTSAGVL